MLASMPLTSSVVSEQQSSMGRGQQQQEQQRKIDESLHNVLSFVRAVVLEKEKQIQTQGKPKNEICQ